MQTLPTDLTPSEPEPFVVLEIHGELDLDTESDFEQAVTARLGDASVVVDLSGVDFLAISSLRALIRCHRTALSCRRGVVYAEAQSQARRLFQVAGLEDYLELADVVPSTPAA